jgi:hypothetical protein
MLPLCFDTGRKLHFCDDHIQLLKHWMKQHMSWLKYTAKVVILRLVDLANVEYEDMIM